MQENFGTRLRIVSGLAIQEFLSCEDKDPAPHTDRPQRSALPSGGLPYVSRYCPLHCQCCQAAGFFTFFSWLAQSVQGHTPAAKLAVCGSLGFSQEWHCSGGSL